MMPTCAAEPCLLIPSRGKGEGAPGTVSSRPEPAVLVLGQHHADLHGAHHMVELLGPARAMVVPGEVLRLLQNDDLRARLLRHAGQVADLEDPQQCPVVPPCTPCCAELPALPLNIHLNCSARPSVVCRAKHNIPLIQTGSC